MTISQIRHNSFIMESETEEEVDLVISKFIPLFECNLSERIDEYKLTELRDRDQIDHFYNKSDKSFDKDNRNIFESRLENFNASINDSPNKFDINWISSSVISDSDCLVNPLIDNSMSIENKVHININEKDSEEKYTSVEKTEQNFKKNVFIEKSQEICLYEYNLPILFDQEVECNKKIVKLFEKYGGRDNVYVESNKVMDSSELEKCKDEQNIEFDTENCSKDHNKSIQRENNNNTRFTKNYLNDKSNLPSSESLPWTMKLRTRKKYIHTKLNVNNKLYSSESEEVLEFEDSEEEWRLGTRTERSGTESDSDMEQSSNFVKPGPNKTSNIIGIKKCSVTLKRVSPSSRKPRGSRQNPRSSSISGAIHYCHHPGCNMFFNRPNKVIIHERTHTGERPFVCSVKGCGRTYTRQTHLQRHMIRNHKPKDSNHTKECEKCGKTFADIYSMQKHVTRYHVRREYSCDVCNKVFKKHQHLRSHSFLHTGIQPYECQHPGCEMRFINPSKLKRHSRIHESGRYECSYETNGVVCGEKFDRHHDLRLHISYNHPKECDICGKQFKQKRSLRIHRATHENVREAFFCPIPVCDKFYYHNKNLTAHIRISHEKSYIFECVECKAILATKQKLSDHMKIHEAGYQRDWSRSKPSAPRKDKGVSRTDLHKLLSGYDESQSDDGTSESELEDMEYEEQREIEDNKESPEQSLSSDCQKSNLNSLTMKPKTLEYSGEMEHMEVDDKMQSVVISESIDFIGMKLPKKIENSYGLNIKDAYFPNSSQFTLFPANDDDDENSDDNKHKKDDVSNKEKFSNLENKDSNKLNQGKILKLVQGKTSTVSIKTKFS